MKNDLVEALPLQTVGELLGSHGIDPTLFSKNTIGLGPSEAYIAGLDHWLKEKNTETTHGQFVTRSKNCSLWRKRTEQAAGGWSLFSVGLNSQGWPSSQLAFIGHRIHPSRRTQGGLKLDATGWDSINKGLT